jgi:hypothetical protein
MFRPFAAFAALAIGFGVATPAEARWKIKFIPDEAESVAVSINGEHAMNWESREGEVLKDVPEKWASLEKIHVHAQGSPRDSVARVQVYWDDDEECDMKFDDNEDCRVNR